VSDWKSAYFMPIPASRRRAGAQQELEFAEWTQDRVEETRFVNEIRQELDKWRFAHWPGTTATTRSRLEDWTDQERSTHLYFCQVETAEAAIWLAEVAPRDGSAPAGWLGDQLASNKPVWSH
jgi:type III restriction enzyme